MQPGAKCGRFVVIRWQWPGVVTPALHRTIPGRRGPVTRQLTDALRTHHSDLASCSQFPRGTVIFRDKNDRQGVNARLNSGHPAGNVGLALPIRASLTRRMTGHRTSGDSAEKTLPEKSPRRAVCPSGRACSPRPHQLSRNEHSDDNAAKHGKRDCFPWTLVGELFSGRRDAAISGPECFLRAGEAAARNLGCWSRLRCLVSFFGRGLRHWNAGFTGRRLSKHCGPTQRFSLCSSVLKGRVIQCRLHRVRDGVSR